MVGCGADQQGLAGAEDDFPPEAVECEPVLRCLLDHHPFAAHPTGFGLAVLDFRGKEELHAAIAERMGLQREDAAGLGELLAADLAVVADQYGKIRKDL